MSEFFRALEQANQDRLKAMGAAAPTAASVEVSPEPPIPDVEESNELSAELPPAEAVLVAARPVTEGVDDHFEGVDDHLVSLVNPAGFEAEQYRALRHLIEQLRSAAEVSVIAVSSPGLGDGKTTTAINLAGSLAQSPDARVLLVELDFRRPTVARHLALRSVGRRGGLINAILTPALQLEDVVHHVPAFNLSVIGAGEAASAPYELLRSPRLGELLDDARRRYDYVVLDTPPLVVVPDCRVITRWVDGFLIVVAAHKTPVKMCAEALGLLDPAKVIGLIFNADDRHLSAHQYYGYHPRPIPSARAVVSRLRARLRHRVRRHSPGTRRG